MGRMRMFLDNLPVRMRRNFYRNNGNFNRELYDQQITENSSPYKMKEIPKPIKLQKQQSAPTITTNGWKTVVTEDWNECNQDIQDKNDEVVEAKKDKKKKDEKKEENNQKKTRYSNRGRNRNKKSKRHNNHYQEQKQNNDTFLFSKISSNAARSRKCAMNSDKSWRRKK